MSSCSERFQGHVLDGMEDLCKRQIAAHGSAAATPDPSALKLGLMRAANTATFKRVWLHAQGLERDLRHQGWKTITKVAGKLVLKSRAEGSVTPGRT